VALAAFVIVALIRPDGVSVAHVLFARSADSFTKLLLRQEEAKLPIETINLLRAQLAADMMFLRRLRASAARVDPRAGLDASCPFCGAGAHHRDDRRQRRKTYPPSRSSGRSSRARTRRHGGSML